MFDNPLTFLILISVISAISDWLGKRRKAAREREAMAGGDVESVPVSEIGTEVPQGEARRSVREQKQEWEERLRRLLEGDEAPVSPSQSPPARSWQGEVPTQATEEVFSEPTRTPVQLVTSQPAPEIADRSASQRIDDVSTDVTLSKPAPAMQVRRRKRVHGPSVVNFQSKDSIRKAIIASVVLGPPKGLGEESDLIRL